MNKRQMLEKRHKKAKRKEQRAEQLILDEQERSEMRQATEEVLYRHRERIEAWAAVLTEEEIIAIDQQILRDCRAWKPHRHAEIEALLNESLSYKLAGMIDGYELAADSGPTPFIGEDGLIDFTKNFSVVDLITETERLYNIPMIFVSPERWAAMQQEEACDEAQGVVR